MATMDYKWKVKTILKKEIRLTIINSSPFLHLFFYNDLAAIQIFITRFAWFSALRCRSSLSSRCWPFCGARMCNWSTNTGKLKKRQNKVYYCEAIKSKSKIESISFFFWLFIVSIPSLCKSSLLVSLKIKKK